MIFVQGFCCWSFEMAMSRDSTNPSSIYLIPFIVINLFIAKTISGNELTIEQFEMNIDSL